MEQRRKKGQVKEKQRHDNRRKWNSVCVRTLGQVRIQGKITAEANEDRKGNRIQITEDNGHLRENR